MSGSRRKPKQFDAPVSKRMEAALKESRQRELGGEKVHAPTTIKEAAPMSDVTTGTKQERFAASARKLVKLVDAGNDAALRKFQGYKPASRARIIDAAFPGIRGTLRESVVEQGLTPRMLGKAAQLRRQMRSTSESTPEPEAKPVKERAKRNKEQRTGKQSPERKPLPKGAVTPAELAKRAGVEPLAVRKYLRSQKRIKKSDAGWALTPKQADAVVEALKS